MKYRLKLVVSAEADFKEIKKDGFGGVIFPIEAVNEEILETAGKSRLKRFVTVRDMAKIGCEYIGGDGVYGGEMLAVTPASAEKAAKSLEMLVDGIDGFILPIPCIFGLFWDNSFPEEYAAFCGGNLYNEAHLLFDADISYADVRVWYYKRAAEKIFSEYVMPAIECLKPFKKTVCFDLGTTRGDFCARKLMLPSLFEKAKISVVREDCGETYFVSHNSGKTAKTLFAAPMRYIMGLYAWDMQFSREESNLSVAVCEEQYYRSSLEKCGIAAYFTDDFALSDMSVRALKRYENILLAKGCMIEKAKKDKLLNVGVKINDAGLMKRLDGVN